jgi:type IV pilus assembly protein PilM
MATKVTLYIEDTDIKLLVTSGKQVEKWASLLLEPKLVRDGVIIDEDKVAESIKTLFKLEGIATKKITVGLSGLNSIFRVITLPELPQALLPEAVMNEAGRVIPVPLEEVYLSYQPIPAIAGETRLFLVAYPKNSTDTLLRTLSKAGLKPLAMDLAPLALCRCANTPRSIIVNSWLTYLDIVIMNDSMPQVIRSMSLPTDAIALPEKLPTITEELNRTVAFYNSSNPENQLDSSVPIFVCGDLAEAQDTWQSLAGKTGYPVSVLQPPIQSPEAFSPSQFMVNIGLALKGQLPKGKDSYYSIVDFDALPEVYKPPAISLVRVFIPVAVVVVLCALAWGGFLVKGVYDDTAGLRSDIDRKHLEVEIKRSQLGVLNSEVDVLSTQIAAVEGDIAAQLEEVAVQQERISQQIEANLQPIEAEDTANSLEDMLTSLDQGLGSIVGDLGELVGLLPTTVNLVGIDYEGGSATLNGFAPAEGDIFTYARALRSGGRFSEVIILSIEETYIQEGGTSRFDFVLLLK